MRNVMLSLVVVAVLVAGAVGGTLAGYSDSETSFDNYIVTGALDLKVNGQDDLPWGDGVDPVIEIDHITPDWAYHYDIEVQNMGQCNQTPHLYFMIKNVECDNINPEHDGYDDPYGPYPYGNSSRFEGYMDNLKPEPELVAEYGGILDCQELPGIGRVGDNCCLTSHVWVTVFYDGIPVWGPGRVLDLMAAGEIYLGELPPCGEVHIVTLVVELPQVPEEVYGYDFFDEDTFHGSKFNDWPTNALMKDRIWFDLEFDLTHVGPPVD